MSLKPRDIHSVWRLLGGIDADRERNLQELAAATLGITDLQELGRLRSIAESLKFVDPNTQQLQCTGHGASFAKAKHWRLWSIPDALIDSFRRLGIEGLFLGEDSWEKRPGVIDLFSGAGGFSLAFESAGFAVIAAIDNDPHACRAFKLNFPNCAVIDRDINEIAGKSTSSQPIDLGVNMGDVVGVVGSPPCQGFSNMGEKLSGDPRNQLASKFFDIVMRIEPSFFVFENVPAIQSFGSRPTFDAFLKRLCRASGSPAAAIARALPTPSGPKLKRTHQVRKRLISRSINETKRLVDEWVQEADDNANSLRRATAIGLKAIAAAAHSRFSEIYTDGQLSEAESALASCESDMAVIIISLAIESFIRRKIIERKWCISAVKRLVARPIQQDVVGRAAGRIIGEFESLPEIDEYRGVSVGPVLRGLIEKASEKYDVEQPQILNALEFGAPQKRQRLFLLGIRKDRTIAEDNEPSPKDFWTCWRDCLNMHRRPGLTAGEAIGDMPNVDDYPELLISDRLRTHELSEQASNFASKLRLEEFNQSDMSLPRAQSSPYWEDGCKRTVHSKSMLERLSTIGEGMQDKTSRRTRLSRSSASQTLRAGTLQDKGSHTAVRPIHYEYNRVITVREGARIMGYPDWMTFHPTNWHGSRLVGNGVPLQLGYAIAASIRDSLALLDGES